MSETCSTCGDPAKGGMCERCIAFEMDYDDNANDCANCNGEGFVSHCFTEYACIHPDEGCAECMRPCDWCTPSHQPKEGGHATTGGHNAD